MARQLEEAFFRSSCLNPRRDDDGGIETPSSAAAGTVRFGKVFLLIFAFAAGWVCSWSRAGMRDLWGVTHNAYGVSQRLSTGEAGYSSCHVFESVRSKSR